MAFRMVVFSARARIIVGAVEAVADPVLRRNQTRVREELTLVGLVVCGTVSHAPAHILVDPGPVAFAAVFASGFIAASGPLDSPTTEKVLEVCIRCGWTAIAEVEVFAVYPVKHTGIVILVGEVTRGAADHRPTQLLRLTVNCFSAGAFGSSIGDAEFDTLKFQPILRGKC
jgi:hypothetical protein